MKRNLSLGALHPILFLVAIYVISVVLAFFVCTTIYNSLHDKSSLTEKEAVQVGVITASR